MNEILFFGGKGGVGKTSCSTSYALSRSQKAKTLLVSTDPAHSISDLFKQPIKDELTKINENLYGLEIDGEKESQNYINKIRGNLHTIMSPIILEEINRQLDAASVSPGTHESALFDKMIDIIINYKDDFEYIVFDTAPTGHTLRLLSLPEILGAWIDSLIQKRSKVLKLKKMISRDGVDDPVITILKRRKKNMDLAREILIDKGILKFVFVLNAEKMPIEETKKAVLALQKNNISIGGLIINKILPDSNDSFWHSKKQNEEIYLKEIEAEFSFIDNIYKIPLFKQDMDESSIHQMVDYFATIK